MAIRPIKLLPKVTRKGSSLHLSWGRDEFYKGGADDQRRFQRQKLARDIADLIPEHRHKMLLGDSRYIYQAFSTVSGAVDQKPIMCTEVRGGCSQIPKIGNLLKR